MRVEIAPEKVLARPQEATRKKSVLVKRISRKTVIYILLIVVTLVVLIPLLWMLTTSLKTEVEASTFPPTLFPAVPQWHPFSHVFTTVPFLTFFPNTGFYTAAFSIAAFLSSSLSPAPFAPP